jgi:hypothetical protein
MLRPHPLNDRLYRPVSSTDPEIIALADSIRKHGLREPLVVTLDDVLLSGHRRLAAARLAGLNPVPCRVEKIDSSDPDALRLLREYNRQRVKSIDEVVREEIVSAEPEESYRFLQEHRRQASKVSADTICIEGHKHRARISKAKQPFLSAVKGVLVDRRDFWPLTDRQIHYALLNNPPLIHASKPNSCYQNTVQAYKSLCELLTRGRISGEIPFHAIHDPTRPVSAWHFYREPAAFIREQLKDFLDGYYRDLQQSQPNQIEIVGEKNTVESIIRPLALEYCVPMTIGRGYSSLPPRYDMACRFQRSGKEKLVLLFLSDFDPEGEDIPHSFARSMRDDFGIENILPIKVGLTADQVDELNLPPQMKAKATSSRYAGFVERHGDDVFELEAVPPEQLQNMLRVAIDGVIDVDAYNAEIDAEKRDAAHLDGVRRAAQRALGDLGRCQGAGAEEE